MTKIRVLFFIYQMGAGGAARTLLNIINNLDRERFEPVLVTLNYNGSYEHQVKDDVTFRKVNTTRLSHSVKELAGLIKEEQADLVFSTIPRVNTIATLAAKMARVPNIVREADNLGGTFKENLQLKGFGLVYKAATQIVSLSEGVKENLVTRYHLKPDAIKVIYNPVDIQHIDEKKAVPLSSSEKRFFAQEALNVITAGRLVPQKDQHTLFKALSIINQEMPVNLIILGEGPLYNELRSFAEELNIQDKISFPGFQDNPYHWIANVDAFVLTSKHEGFSHVLAEALACGTRIVSTDCKSGPSEVLDNGKFGELVPVGDAESLAEALKSVLTESPEKRALQTKNGRERAMFFRADKIVREYEKLFQLTVERKSKGVDGS